MIKILIVDFGSQYTHLIYHKTKYRLGCQSKLIDYHDFNPITENYQEYNWIILSGGPNSVEDTEIKWTVEKNLQNSNVLGICFGAQLLAKEKGYQFESRVGEYGSTHVNFTFDDFETEVWMSHQDFIVPDPSNPNDQLVRFVGYNQDGHPVAWEWENNLGKLRVGLQFHPEVDHTVDGLKILRDIFELELDQELSNLDQHQQNLITQLKEDLLQKVTEDDQIFLAISGGVDSSTLGLFLSQSLKASQLHFYLVDNGLMRKNEIKEVYQALNQILPTGTLELIEAEDLFLERLKGIQNPEEKRKIIGHSFIDVFTEKIQKSLEKNPLSENGKAYFVQGTIWPDVIESGQTKMSQTIKSHHNVGGLPETLPCQLLEPFRELYKDDIRMIASHLGLPDLIKNRHPFPGPGLAIRILGEITKEKVEIVQEADLILRNYLKDKNLEDQVWQAGTVLLPIKSVGVKGDNRSYQESIVLRMVDSNNGMTAKPSLIPIQNLVEIGHLIQTRVSGINRVVYDLSSKPPATIEWE